jgi:cytochrome b involved in lipid metabolism
LTHNNIKDAWIIIRDKVYDITKYLDYHPGGIDVLRNYLGKDATNTYGIIL